MFNLQFTKNHNHFKKEHVLERNGDFLFLHEKISAKRSFERENKEFFAIIGAISILTAFVIIYFWGLPKFLIFCFALATCFYLFSLIFKVILVSMSVMKKLPSPTEEEIHKTSDQELPPYTILVPLYKEGAVLKEFVDYLQTIDYPREKLDVRLLLEADDDETISVAHDLKLNKPFSVVIIPNVGPRTKPKALNVGIIDSEGEILTIYDAEDRPDRDQLRKVAWAFKNLPENVICIQAKLTFHNLRQNILTRWFFAEYFTWFNYLLPGLSSLGLPIPLGGTSNHFRTAALKKIGAWDPYNVTEDADLGIRISRLAYKTATIDSSSNRLSPFNQYDKNSIVLINTSTNEEANSMFINWFYQRTRWIKGYIQTSLVHLRHPAQALNDMSLKGVLSFLFFISGTPIANLLNLVMWIITAFWLFGISAVLPNIMPPAIMLMGFISLVVGNAFFILLHLIPMVAKKKWSIALATLFIPIYWLMMSLASLRAVWQLMTNPHYWEKTKHGLMRKEPLTRKFAETGFILLFVIFFGFSMGKFYGVVMNSNSALRPDSIALAEYTKNDIASIVSDSISLKSSEAALEQTPEPEVLGVEISAARQWQNILADAATISSGNLETILSAVGATRNTQAEADVAAEYLADLTGDFKTLPGEVKSTITDFVTYGTPTTVKLGIGVRAGVINSFRAAFGKVPTAQTEWRDCLAIGNGRWPNEKNSETEANAENIFKKIYERNPDRNDLHDNSAITLISYGLRPAERNLDNERAAIESFMAIYGYAPEGVKTWDIVLAIAYSGAKR